MGPQKNVTVEGLVAYLQAEDFKRGWPLSLDIRQDIKEAITEFLKENRDEIIKEIARASTGK